MSNIWGIHFSENSSLKTTHFRRFPMTSQLRQLEQRISSQRNAI